MVLWEIIGLGLRQDSRNMKISGESVETVDLWGKPMLCEAGAEDGLI